MMNTLEHNITVEDFHDAHVLKWFEDLNNRRASFEDCSSQYIHFAKAVDGSGGDFLNVHFVISNYYKHEEELYIDAAGFLINFTKLMREITELYGQWLALKSHDE